MIVVSYHEHSMKTMFPKKNIVGMSDMAATCAHSSQKLLAEVLILFLGRHSARKIHSMALDETHDENVAPSGLKTGKV